MALDYRDQMIQLTTMITYGQKMLIERMALLRANGSDTDMAPYVREGIELVAAKYGVKLDTTAPVA